MLGARHDLEFAGIFREQIEQKSLPPINLGQPKQRKPATAGSYDARKH